MEVGVVRVDSGMFEWEAATCNSGSIISANLCRNFSICSMGTNLIHLKPNALLMRCPVSLTVAVDAGVGVGEAIVLVVMVESVVDVVYVLVRSRLSSVLEGDSSWKELQLLPPPIVGENEVV